MYVVAGLLFLSLQTGCLRQQEQPPVGSRSGYAGCLSAVASGKNSAIITVDLPDKATEVEVYRDGKKNWFWSFQETQMETLFLMLKFLYQGKPTGTPVEPLSTAREKWDTNRTHPVY